MTKAELKTKKTTASAAAYIAAIPDLQMRSDAKVLAKIMQKATGARPVMWGSSMVGFGNIHYTYASGREGEWMKIGFAPRKGMLSLYLMCDLTEGSELLKKLGKHKRGVGCLYVKRLSDVDMGVLTKLINYAARTVPKWLASRQ